MTQTLAWLCVYVCLESFQKELIKFPPQITLELEVRRFSKFVIRMKCENFSLAQRERENMKLMKLNNGNGYPCLSVRVYHCVYSNCQ